MPKLTAGAAAKAVGVNRSTVQRYIANGKLSCELQPNGARVIDVSELERVFGSLRPPAAPSGSAAPVAERQSAAPHAADDAAALTALRHRVELLDARLEAETRARETAEAHVRDLQRRLAAEAEERRALTQRLLGPPEPAPAAAARPWWRRWRRG